MADSVLYIVQGAAGRDSRWRDAVEMALTGAAFALPTRVWLGPDAVAALARRDDGDALLAELTDFGVSCVADQAHRGAGAPTAIAWLDTGDLNALRDQAAQIIVLS
ncbi:hypothetical protein ACLD02_17710 [Alloalcanivorax sp. C16-2]|uniref:hypothetical protein n=1 Tax=Alloalcanivorax sp. C16-2 TaxID=3390052 RepID=UPI003970D020